MLPSISSIMCFSLCHPNGLLYICSIGLSDCRGTKTAIWYNLYFSLVLNQTYSAISPILPLGFGCVKSLPHIHPFYYLLTFLWINTPFLFLMWRGGPHHILAEPLVGSLNSEGSATVYWWKNNTMILGFIYWNKTHDTRHRQLLCLVAAVCMTKGVLLLCNWVADVGGMAPGF